MKKGGGLTRFNNNLYLSSEKLGMRNLKTYVTAPQTKRQFIVNLFPRYFGTKRMHFQVSHSAEYS